MQASATLSPPSLRASALAALCESDPGRKVAAAQALWAAWSAGAATLDPTERLMPAPGTALPGRPARPELLAPVDVPQRSPFTPPGLAMLLHAVTHIEFNAIKMTPRYRCGCVKMGKAGISPEMRRSHLPTTQVARLAL